MKLIKFICLFTLSVIVTSCNGQQNKDTKTQNPTISKIEVLGFHSTHRCFTCKAIEKHTKHTLEAYFSDALENGKITFKTTNVDENSNAALAEKYGATGTSLFLNIIKNGKEQQINLTEFAFMKGKDKKAFSTELKNKIERELANL